MIYKYLDIDKAIFFLKQKCLTFTPPKYFNDIYELLPSTNNEISDSEILNHFLDEEFIAKFLKKSKNDSTHYIGQAKNSSVVMRTLKEKIIQKNNELAEKMPELMSRYIGVLSLTNNPLSNTMWAHYSENHTGICIGFDFKETEIELIENRDVEYKSERVVLPNTFITYSKEKRNRVFAKICFTKGYEWKYEDEHRFVIDLSNCDRKRYKRLRVFTIQLNLMDIKKIFFGKRISTCNKKKIRNMLPDINFVNIHTSEFQYRLVEKNAK